MKERMIRELSERFGFPDTLFDKVHFIINKRKKVFAYKCALDVEKVLSIGLPFARLGRVIKPTTEMTQLFGRYAKKNIVSLTKKQAIEFMRGYDINLEPPALNPEGPSDGYIIVRYRDYSLGCGLLSRGKIKNMIPKGKRMEIKLL